MTWSRLQGTVRYLNNSILADRRPNEPEMQRLKNGSVPFKWSWAGTELDGPRCGVTGVNGYVPDVADLLADSHFFPHSSKLLFAGDTSWGSTAFVPTSCILNCQVPQDALKIPLRFPMLRSWGIISQLFPFTLWRKKKKEAEMIKKGRNSDSNRDT